MSPQVVVDFLVNARIPELRVAESLFQAAEGGSSLSWANNRELLRYDYVHALGEKLRVAAVESFAIFASSI